MCRLLLCFAFALREGAQAHTVAVVRADCMPSSFECAELARVIFDAFSGDAQGPR